jgi:hypothetical protein
MIRQIADETMGGMKNIVSPGDGAMDIVPRPSLVVASYSLKSQPGR